MKVLTAAIVVALCPLLVDQAAASKMLRLEPKGSLLVAGQYSIDLGEADDPTSARAWQGPIRVTSRAGNSCNVNDSVAIVERPFGFSAKHLLIVTTYSGSEDTLYVVDLRNCRIKYKSSPFVGAPIIKTEILLIPRDGTYRLDTKGQLFKYSEH